MEKNWLIRTKSNHILGPISREKLVELLSNHSILQDDEICSGNGYWFFVRENELVEKYVYQQEKQTFNPVSEAEDVLSNLENNEIKEADDITMVGKVDAKLLNQLKLNKETTTDSKKKSKKVVPVFKTKKNSYLKLILIGLIIAFVLILGFRTKLSKLMVSEINKINVIESAHAQFELELSDLKKKSFFPS